MKLQAQMSPLATAVSSGVTPAGKAGGQSVGKSLVLASVLALGVTALNANAAITIPAELTEIFTDLGTAVGTFLAAGAVLFGIIRGGVALFKVAGRIFSAAGA